MDSQNCPKCGSEHFTIKEIRYRRKKITCSDCDYVYKEKNKDTSRGGFWDFLVDVFFILFDAGEWVIGGIFDFFGGIFDFF